MSEYKCSRSAFLKTMGGVMTGAVLGALSNVATAQVQAPVVGSKKVTSDFKGEKAKVFFTRHIANHCQCVLRTTSSNGCRQLQNVQFRSGDTATRLDKSCGMDRNKRMQQRVTHKRIRSTKSLLYSSIATDSFSQHQLRRRLCRRTRIQS